MVVACRGRKNQNRKVLKGESLRNNGSRFYVLTNSKNMESSNVNIGQSRAKNQEDVPLKNVGFSVRRKNKNLNLKVDLPVIICQFTNILLENQMRIFKDT